MDSAAPGIDVVRDPLRARKQLETEWERYVSGLKPASGIRRPIIESWERCKERGLDAGTTLAPVVVEECDVVELWNHHPLHHLAEPIFRDNRVMNLISDSRQLLVVANPDGVLLRVEGNPSVRLRAASLHFHEGTRWLEEAAGTNAIGVAVTRSQPIQVFGPEHFSQKIHDWVCSSSPVRDPETGDTLAIIDLTGPLDTIHPHALTIVVTLCKILEQQLRVESQMHEALLRNYFHEAVARPGAAPAAALTRSGRIVVASPAFYETHVLDGRCRLKGVTPASLAAIEGEAELRIPGLGDKSIVLRLLPVLHDGRRIGYIATAEPKYSRVREASVRVPTRGDGGGAGGYPRIGPADIGEVPFILGQSAAMQRVIAVAHRVAPTPLPVMLTGETGTGKEVLARAIHAWSGRGPFVAVNCAAVPRELLVSELFGYEKGAFTGAAREGFPGRFKLAHGGTLFLDEIGDMSPEGQATLLRVLDQGEITPLGARKTVRVDVRIICATNRDLLYEVQLGRFREDLYHRLQGVQIHLPPLRERSEDIVLLAREFLRRNRAELGLGPLDISPEVVEVFRRYPWPGNVRELKNLCYALAVQLDEGTLTVEDLPAHIRDAAIHDRAATGKAAGQGTLLDIERRAILEALDEHGGSVAKAARKLGISRATLYRKLKQMGIR
ncbi:MAG TPA: sigma-54-dependent Fis family transcriptional regulator [Thermaerobacter sp.]